MPQGPENMAIFTVPKEVKDVRRAVDGPISLA
jgi:hypothetical protein